MEKLLVIGAGIGQVPLIEKAQKKGIHVTVVSIPGSYPGFKIANDIIYKDIFDRESIVEEAKKRGITAVISDQNDLMMPTVAYVAEALGIPGNKFETVVSYCNKNQFRDICDIVGVPTPKHTKVTSLNHDFSSFLSSFPLIVKPADSQSSIGVKKVNNKNELNTALDIALKKSPTKNAIVEEYFVGKEIVCEGFIENGNYYLLQFADRKYFDIEEFLIPSQTIFPSNVKKEILDKIVTFEKRIAQHTHPNFAIVHSEYLINEETGDIRIVESALRGGGVYISSDLIPLSTNININEILLNKALGQEVDLINIFSKKQNLASAYVCFYLPTGKVISIAGIKELNALPFVSNTYLEGIKIGIETEPMTYKGARKGPIIVFGKNREDIENNIKKVQETLKIEVLSKDGFVKGIQWT